MDDVTFRTNMDAVLAVFKQEGVGFDALMDRMAVECTDEQWQLVLETLEGVRDQLRQAARDAEQRIGKMGGFRPVQEQAVPGTVWLAFENKYETGFLDVCQTRAGAVEAVEARVQERHATKKQPPRWKGRWKKAEAHCPCPIIGCSHEQWTRSLFTGYEYVVQNWSTQDGKWRSDAL